jgi:TonB-linked SusC/RagA family outer membrane protein
MKSCQMRRFIVFVFLAICQSVGLPILQAQEGFVTGVILDAEKGDPVSGASIQLKGGRVLAVTDSRGAFRIRAVKGAILQVSSIGYGAAQVTVGEVLELQVRLVPSSSALNEVVVVGYGEQKAPTVTGAVGVISGKSLVQTPVANVTQMLVGRTAGISSVQNSGEPGLNTTTIRIRGVATLNGQDPLVVIDGIQQPAEQPFTILNAMDPNEIDNISILKDASSTAVFGIRGANGVIIVTTKRGRVNKPQFSFSMNQGFTNATSIFNTIDSYRFAELRNEAIYNTKAAGDNSLDRLLFTQDELWKFQNNRDYTPAEVDAMSNLNPAQKEQLKNTPALYYTTRNWYKDQFGGVGRQAQYNLNVSGGTSRVKYFTSLGYFNQQGILSNTEYAGSNTNPAFTRYNFKSNFDFDIARNFQLQFNISGQSTVNKVAGTGTASDFGNRYQGIIQNILENSPFVGPGIVDGKLVNAFIGIAGEPTNPLGAKGGTGNSSIAQLLTGGTRTMYTTVLSSVLKLKHNMGYLARGLESHVQVAYDDSYSKGFSRVNSMPVYNAMRDPANPLDIVFVGGRVNPPSVSDNQGNSQWRKLYLEAALSYRRSFNKHNVSGLLLGNAQRYTASGQAFGIPSGLMGLVGRTTYNFDQRYLAEFNLGINGTENFAPGNRFGVFPALSAGWILANEKWFPKNSILTWAKIRGSYGEVGNDQIGGRRFLYLPNTWTGSAAGSNWGNANGSTTNPNIPGATESALGNPLVTWERARKRNVTIDLKFLKDRFTLTTSLFDENRDKILVTSQLAPSTYGVATASQPPINVGKVSNRGFEIEAGWDHTIGKVDYFVKANYSFARNRIDYRAEVPMLYPWLMSTGYAIGQYKGLLTDGFYNSPDELNNRPFNKFGNNARLGDLRFRDVNADGFIDQNDLVPIGYANLPQVSYNFTLGFSWKGLDVSALIIGSARGSFPQSGYILSTPFAKNVGQVLEYAYEGRWTPEKAAKGQPVYYPSISLGGVGAPNNGQLSDFWLRPNDFTRLKNLEVAYTFSARKGFMKRADIRGLRVYANGNNLATWGSHLIDGIDPEQADTGKNRDGYLFPLTRTYNFGVSLQF